VSLRGLVIILGLVVPCAAAYAQTDYSAGKTAVQLFSGDCSVCHKSPRGLAKTRDPRALTSFLREHYTSKAESAGALAAYLLGNPGSPTDAEARKRQGTPGAAPGAPGEEGAPRQAARGKKQTPAELAREREAAAKAAEEAAKAKLNAYASTGERARPLVVAAPPAAESAPAVPPPATVEPATPPAPAEAPKAEVGTAPAESQPPAAERPASTPPG
jgi:hypothetical protein